MKQFKFVIQDPDYIGYSYVDLNITSLSYEVGPYISTLQCFGGKVTLLFLCLYPNLEWECSSEEYDVYLYKFERAIKKKRYQ